MSEQMLTEEQIITIKKAAIATDPGKPWGDSIAFARAIESAVRAEYADVPPEKFKALYLACRGKGPGVWVGDICDALDSIDNGTYNPKIGGEE